MTSTETIVAVATAPGRGGIGVVRLSGPKVTALMLEIVGTRLFPRRATRADFLGERGQVIDCGIALYYPAPHSYTGEEVLELQGHGSPVVLRMLLKRCTDLGARTAEPGEFTKRAYLNHKLDLAQAEAVADLIEASTTQAARSALHSLQGVFSQRIAALLQELIDLRVLVEAELDFPDEEEAGAVHRGEVGSRLARLHESVLLVLAASRKGSLLREGMRIVLAGQPNVGKSSLLNRLAGEDLAIVTAVPGTTRDAIRMSIDLAGIPAHFIDTAGLRSSDDPVEKIGVERTWALLGQADAVVLIVDAALGETAADREIISRLPAGMPCVRVMNKIDLGGRQPAVTREGGRATVWLSALTGCGLELLQEVLLEMVGWQGDSEGLFMARARHVEALEQTRAHLEQALAPGKPVELLAEELRLAQEALGTITGKYTSDALLGEIFSRFCIGK